MATTVKIVKINTKDYANLKAAGEEGYEIKGKIYYWDKDTVYVNPDTDEVLSDITAAAITECTVFYALSDSPTVAPTGGWSPIAPVWLEGKYMWQKTVTYYESGASSESDPTCISGATGQKGDTGEAGADGTSPYQLDIENEFDSIPCSNEGIIPASYDWEEETTHVVRAYCGSSSLSFTVASQPSTGFVLTYSISNVSFRGTDKSTAVSSYSAYIDNLTADVGSVTYSLYYNTNVIATCKFEASKNKAGQRGLQGIQGLQGLQGEKGETGIQGPAGNNGATSYFHIKYSAIANPTRPEEISETPNKYIGTYVDFIKEDSTEPSKYKWSMFEGDQGIPGENGEDGDTSYLHIKYSNDGGQTFTENEGETPGYWIGQYVDFIQEDSKDVTSYKWAEIKGNQGIPGEKGDNGVTYYTWIKYSHYSNGYDKEGKASMTDTPVADSEYLGMAYNKTEKTESGTPSDYKWSKFKGDQGIQGKTGTDGKTYYTWVKYANKNTPEASEMSDNPIDPDTGIPYKFIGLAYNKESKEESTIYTDYKWAAYVGDEGEAAIDYKIVASDKNFIKKADGSVTPQQITFKFFTQQGSEEREAYSGYYTIKIDNGIESSGAIGSEVNILATDLTKNATVTLYTNNTKEALLDTETVSLITDGSSVGSIINYYQISSSTTAPAYEDTNWVTANIPQPTKQKPYLWNYEAIYNTLNELINRSTPTIIGNYSVDGKGIKSIIDQFKTTTTSTPPSKTDTGWSTSSPQMSGNNKYLWKYEQIVYTDDSTKETDVTLIGTLGEKGEKGATGATGPQGPQGATGPTGTTGTSVNSVVKYYKLATGTPAKPSVKDPIDWYTSPPTFVAGNNYYESDRTLYSNDSWSWSPVIKNSMLTVDFINSLGITAKKIDIIDGSSNHLFTADGTTGNVSICNFNVDSNSMMSGTWGESESVMICTGTNSSKSIGGSASINGWCFTAGSTFGVTKTGNIYANAGKIGGLTINAGDGLSYGNVLKITPKANIDPRMPSFHMSVDSAKIDALVTGFYRKNYSVHWVELSKEGLCVKYSDSSTSATCIYRIPIELIGTMPAIVNAAHSGSTWEGRHYTLWFTTCTIIKPNTWKLAFGLEDIYPQSGGKYSVDAAFGTQYSTSYESIPITYESVVTYIDSTNQKVYVAVKSGGLNVKIYLMVLISSTRTEF